MDRSPDVHAQEAWIGPATLGLAESLFPRPFRLPAPVAQRGHTMAASHPDQLNRFIRA